MVRWPTKKGQSQLYPAKILKMSDDKRSLIKLREQLVQGRESEGESGRGKRKRKPLHISSSDEELEDTQKMKKRTERRPSLLSKLLDKRKEQLSDSTAEKKCTTCSDLKEKLKQLEEENRTLVRRLDSIHELKTMMCELKEGLEVRFPSSKHHNLVIPSHPNIQCKPKEGFEAKCTSKHQNPVMSTSPTYPHPKPNQENSCEDAVTIADGVTISKVKLLRCNHQQPTKLVCDLLGVVFTREELSTHSLTGQKGSQLEAVKPSLDKKLVDAIFDYTLKKFPAANLKDLRGAVRNKLNNESKLFKKGCYHTLVED